MPFRLIELMDEESTYTLEFEAPRELQATEHAAIRLQRFQSRFD